MNLCRVTYIGGVHFVTFTWHHPARSLFSLFLSSFFLSVICDLWSIVIFACNRLFGFLLWSFFLWSEIYFFLFVSLSSQSFSLFLFISCFACIWLRSLLLLYYMKGVILTSGTILRHVLFFLAFYVSLLWSVLIIHSFSILSIFLSQSCVLS